MTIRKMPSGKHRLVSKKGRNLGEFDTRREAHVREGQVKAFDARDKRKKGKRGGKRR